MIQQLNGDIVFKAEPMPGVYLVRVLAPDIAHHAKPGQFIMVGCNRMLRRPLSIHQVTEKGEIVFLIKVTGIGTAWIAECSVTEKLDLLGPFGNGFTLFPDSSSVLLVAGGLGIAPLTFLAKQAVGLGKRVTLLMGACTAADLYPVEFLPENIQTFVTTDDGTMGAKGQITSLFHDFVDSADQVFACGPLPMYETLNTLMQDRKVSKYVQVSLEVRMGCGLGTCYSCSIKMKDGMRKVCQDGPVFDLSDVILGEVKV